MSYVDIIPRPKPPIENPIDVPEIGHPPGLEDIPDEEDDDDGETDEEALARAKRLLSKVVMPCWADYVAEEEEALHEKMARLRAARLAQASS